MSKEELNIKENIMNKIKSGSIKMKSKWYFVFGSIVSMVGIVFLIVTVVFLVNLTVFSLRAHGPMASIRYEQLISNFPLWAPIVAVLGIVFGIWILKRFDFSYKNNFIFIVISFVLSVILAGWLIDYLGFNNFMNRGPMRGFYKVHQNGGGLMNGQGMRNYR